MTIAMIKSLLDACYQAKRIRDRDVRYRKTLALLPEGVAILGEGWRIDWVNARGAEHFGIAPEMIGRSFFDVVTDERLRHWLFERNFAGRCNYTSKAGLDLDVSVVAPDSRHMMIVTHDVTERLRIDEMRRDFVANVSHELRTPLTVISGFLDIESQGKVPANVMQKHRELMLDQARRMQSLLDDLLLLSGLENRDETDSDDAEVISMTKLLEDVVNEGRALSLGRHVITLEACRASLVGEPSDIRSAAMNLVSNAVRYTPEGGRIDVRWFRTSSGAVLSVLYISERAADDMRYEKAVVVVSDEVVSVHGKKMPRAYGIKIQSFRGLRRGEEIQLRRFQYSFFC